MATKPKSKKPSSKAKPNTKTNRIVAGSKKQYLSQKQWSIVAIIGVTIVAVVTYFGVQSYQNTQTNAASCISKTYKQGSSGSCIKYAQRILNNLNYRYYGHNEGGLPHMNGKQIATDGAFGPATEAQVKNFQKSYNYQNSPNLTIDGIIGPKTWGGLCDYAGMSTNKTSGDAKIRQLWSDAKSIGCKV